MKPLALEEIRTAIHGRWIAKGDGGLIKSVTIDSRSAGAGELFFAIRGQRFDGHTFLADAAKAGCRAAVVRLDREPPPDIKQRFPGGVIIVPDTTAALGALAAHHRKLVPATVVGVTGSNGKTTVKRMIHHVLRRSLAGSCSPKSFNNEIGVPLTLLGVAPGDDYVVCEIGTSAPGEVSALAGLARPDVAVITSIAETHLEKLGSIERVAAEKASILGRLSRDGLAVIWGDSELLARAVGAYDARIVRFGESDSAELRLTGYQVCDGRRKAQLNGRLWFELALAGRHNALNALAAVGTAQRLGLSQEQAVAALADFEGVEMRLQRLQFGDVTVFNDAYNANPASLVAAADVLGETDATRRVLIAGDMRELGDRAEELHLRSGERIAERQIDLLIGVGPLGRYIARGAMKCGVVAEQFDSVDELAANIPQLLCEGDAVLIKGSRAMQMEQLIEPIAAAFGRADGSDQERK